MDSFDIENEKSGQNLLHPIPSNPSIKYHVCMNIYQYTAPNTFFYKTREHHVFLE